MIGKPGANAERGVARLDERNHQRLHEDYIIAHSKHHSMFHHIAHPSISTKPNNIKVFISTGAENDL